MKYLLSCSVLFLLIVLLPFTSRAKVTLPAIIGDSMVLQQLSKVPLWGKASISSNVTVTTGWNEADYSVISDEMGNWRVMVTTPAAGGPYEITINEVKIKGVMIGEVWLCSGQSNMQWTVSQSDHSEEEIVAAIFPDIRFFTVQREASDEPKIDCKGHWNSCSPSTTAGFSATAYYFGREIHRKLGVPVGLIHSSWGGSPAEAWTRREILESDEDLMSYLIRYENKRSEEKTDQPDNMTPSALYNAMIAPLIPFAIKGAIWYQGEANRNEANLYEKLFPAMINNWRTDWNLDNFPFYYVQIAPFDYDEPVAGALLRDAQRKSLGIPNTGMVVTLDIGDPNNIHPGNKQDVGKRLALLALAKSYGMKTLAFSGPLYKSMSIENDKIRLQFDYTGGGLKITDSDSCGFLIAGSDRVFKPANVQIDQNDLLVSSPEVPKPVAVRYAFENTSQAYLFNEEGFPASTFRTDAWTIITDLVRFDIQFNARIGNYVVTLTNDTGKNEIRYTLDGSDPEINSPQYSMPFVLHEACTLKARAFSGSTASLVITSKTLVKHLALGKIPLYKARYSNKYTAGGEFGLTDGMRGSTDFLDGSWQGFQGDNLDVLIDLGQKHSLTEISTGFLSVENSWIFLPEYVEYSFSVDGAGFDRVCRASSPEGRSEKEFMQNYTVYPEKKEARFIRIFAKNRGVCPPGHPGAGEKAWIFTDEIEVR